MSKIEQAIEITAKIYDIRRTLRRATEATIYAAEIQAWQDDIRRAMQAHRCGELEAAMHCIREINSEYGVKLGYVRNLKAVPNPPELKQMWILAAAAEIIEPSEPGEL